MLLSSSVEGYLCIHSYPSTTFDTSNLPVSFPSLLASSLNSSQFQETLIKNSLPESAIGNPRVLNNVADDRAAQSIVHEYLDYGCELAITWIASSDSFPVSPKCWQKGDSFSNSFLSGGI